MFVLILDSEHIQKLAVESVHKTGVFDRAKVSSMNTTVQAAARMCVSITGLDEFIATPVVASPGETVGMRLIGWPFLFSFSPKRSGVHAPFM